MTSDQISPLLSEGDTLDHKELIEKVEDLFNKNCHKAYEKFSVTLVKDQKLGWALVFAGDREETKQETAIREAAESAKRKRIQDAELKEYLRLKKIYGKSEK